MRTPARLAAVIATVALVGALIPAGTAGAQSTHPEVRLESTGPAVATLTLGRHVMPLPTNTEHPYGWIGEGRFDIRATTCRIVVDGVPVAEGAGHCRWP